MVDASSVFNVYRGREWLQFYFNHIINPSFDNPQKLEAQGIKLIQRVARENSRLMIGLDFQPQLCSAVHEGVFNGSYTDLATAATRSFGIKLDDLFGFARLADDEWAIQWKNLTGHNAAQDGPFLPGYIELLTHFDANYDVLKNFPLRTAAA